MVSRQGVLHSSVCANMAGMSRAGCLLRCSTSSAFGADLEDVSSEAFIFVLIWGQILRMSRADRISCWPDSWARILFRMPQEAQEATGRTRRYQDATRGCRSSRRP
eukprot:5936319-Pyramimonas_sp.AAC.1